MCGYPVESVFRLPEAGWRKDYYDPMLKVVARCRERYDSDPALAAILNSLGTEAAMYQKYSRYYGYSFFIAQPE